jgi:hypothetical protein
MEYLNCASTAPDDLMFHIGHVIEIQQVFCKMQIICSSKTLKRHLVQLLLITQIIV